MIHQCSTVRSIADVMQSRVKYCVFLGFRNGGVVGTGKNNNRMLAERLDIYIIPHVAITCSDWQHVVLSSCTTITRFLSSCFGKPALNDLAIHAVILAHCL